MFQCSGYGRLIRRELCVSRRKQISVRSPGAQRRGLARSSQDHIKEAELGLEYLQLSVWLFRQSKAPRCESNVGVGAQNIAESRAEFAG